MIDVMEAPEGVRREAVPNSVCVQFYGPSASKGRDRDYCWATAEQLAPFGLNLALLEQQNIPKRMRPTAYREALVEARALYEEHGNNVSAVVAFDPEEAAADAAAADDLEDADAPRCSSCSLALDAPGGHKDTGRCRLCAKLYREGQYCPVCDKVWQWANCPAMVGCDSCDFWVHCACDEPAKTVMAAQERGDEVDYHCPRCRVKADEADDKRKEKEAKSAEKEAARRAKLETKRAAKKAGKSGKVKALGVSPKGKVKKRGRPPKSPVEPPNKKGRPLGSGKSQASIAARKIKEQMGNVKPPMRHPKAPGGIPRRPKSAWQLFGSDFFKRYKVEHAGEDMDFASLYKIQGQAWRDVSKEERARYEHLAAKETVKFRKYKQQLEANGLAVDDLLNNGKAYGGRSPKQKPVKAVKVRPCDAEADKDEMDENGRLDMGGGLTKDPKTGKIYDFEGNPLLGKEAEAAEAGWRPRMDRRASHWSQHFKVEDIMSRPERVEVECNGVRAHFLVREFKMLCQCSQCKGQGKPLSATEFEKHAGMEQAKKWKASIRMIEPARMPIGRWLDGGKSKRKSAAASVDVQKKGRKGKFPELVHGKKRSYQMVRVQWSVDRCAVCDDDRDFDFDQLVTCDGCGISVHQSCYGIPEIPDDAVGFLCNACEHTGGDTSETPLCVLCPVEGGALKPTTKPSAWCHSACCQWIPETTVVDIDRMEPIDQIETIQRERWELLCTVCKQRMGAKIQCDAPGCYLSYHPLCARAAGLFMQANLDDDDDDDSPLQMISYCHRHCRVDTERAALYSGGEGKSIGRDGKLVEAKEDHTKKLTKGVKKRMEEEKKKSEQEAEERKAVEDEALDTPEDERGAARCREYAPQGHPRTEAGDEIIMALDSGPNMRRALQHGLGHGPGRKNRGPRRREREAWVQCESCNKWRRVPQSQAEEFSRADAGEWICSVSSHPKINSCDVPQELEDDDIDARIAMGDECPFYDDDDLDPPEIIAEEPVPEDEEDEEEEEGYEGNEEEEDDEEEGNEESSSEPDDEDVKELRDVENEDWDGHGKSVEEPLAIAAAVGDDDDDLAPPAKRVRFEDALAQVEEDDGDLPSAVFSDNPIVSEVKLEAESPRFPEAMIAAAMMVPSPIEESPAVKPKAPAMTPEQALAAAMAASDDDDDDDDAEEAPAAMDVDLDGNADAEIKTEGTEDGEGEDGEGEDGEGSEEPPAEPAAPLSDLPDVRVVCKSFHGMFRPRDNLIECECGRCVREREEPKGKTGERLGIFEPNRWEVHAGMGHAKKWKQSIVVIDPKLQPEVTPEREGKPDPVEVTFGQWLDDNGLKVEVVQKSRRRKIGRPKADDDRPKAPPKPRAQYSKTNRNKTALATLAIDLDLDLNKASDNFEEKARALIGRRVRVNCNAGPKGAPLILGGAPNKPPEWVSGTVQDMKSSRGGCRHLILHDDGSHEWYSLNRVQTEWPGGEDGDDEEPDLTFMPAAEVPKGSVQGSRRGLSGLQSMLALSKAPPAKKGTHSMPVIKEEDGDGPDIKQEDPSKPPGRVREKEAWLRCGNVECCKWRRVPESVVAALEREKTDAAAAALEAKEAADRGDAGAAAAAAARAAPPQPWTCDRSGDEARNACDAEPEFGEAEVSVRIAAAERGEAPLSMYADGTVCDDEEEKPFIDNGLEGVLPDDLPDIVTVICRHKVGEYSPRTGMIRCLCPSCVIATKEGRDDESLQEPNRWEMHCDMGQAKKWKASVRVVLEGHKTMPVGKWLEGFGIAVASRRAPRQQRQFGPKRSKLKRMKERGELEEETYRRLMPMKGWKKGGEVHRGPPPRSGKREFVELIPYKVNGAKLRSKGGNNSCGYAAPGAGGVGGGVKTGKDPAKAEGVGLPEATVFTPSEWEAQVASRLAAKTTGAVAVAAMAEAAKIVDEGKGVRERVAECLRLRRERLTFGKSNIHGWGLVAKQFLKAGSMVIEYVGERVRPSVADLREKVYERTGHDVYLLAADSKTVVDTTVKGSIARFTNHSCTPNLYTKLVTVDGDSRIFFFTRIDVHPGQELTYNYRFDAESGKVPCYCGANNCRGFLC